MIEVFFDVSSPWTYLAFHRLLQAPPEVRAQIVWKPILVGGVFNTVNPSVYASREQPVPAKARYMLKDLQDWARLYSLKIKMPPSVFPVNSVKVMRACLVLEPEGKLVDFAQAAFEAYWGRDEDIADDAVLAELCRRLSIDFDRLLPGIARADVKARLRANTDDLIARGGFGSPTIFVDGGDMYFGNDRVDLALRGYERNNRSAQLVAAMSALPVATPSCGSEGPFGGENDPSVRRSTFGVGGGGPTRP